jgi:hypothetical protein
MGVWRLTNRETPSLMRRARTQEGAFGVGTSDQTPRGTPTTTTPTPQNGYHSLAEPV